MRPVSLNDLDKDELIADIAIVGGGTVGLFLAAELAGKGLKIVVLESGGPSLDEAVSHLNEAVIVNDNYSGARDGRARGLGGTSNIWGGAFLPFVSDDFKRNNSGLKIDWPVGFEEVMSYLPRVEARFGLTEGDYEPENDLDKNENFRIREAKWPSFRRRNVWTTTQAELERSESVSIIVDATLTDIQIEADETTGAKNVEKLVFRSLDGAQMTVSSRSYVLSCGAIENTRQLLQLRASNRDLFENSGASLGTRFQDHLSIQLGHIDCLDFRALNRFAAFRFEKDLMRSHRFELNPAFRKTSGHMTGFVHLSFDPPSDSGFVVLREVMRKLQSRQVPLKDTLKLCLDIPYFLQLIWWRFRHKQLLWPKGSTVIVNVVIEQFPSKENAIGLSESEDVFGNALPEVTWSPSDADIQTLNMMTEAFEEFWSRNYASRFGPIQWKTPPGQIDQSCLTDMDDIYHPTGTTPLGYKKDGSVLDANLALHAVPNLYALSTAAFPNGGVSNPTATLLLFASRLADHLTEKFKS